MANTVSGAVTLSSTLQVTVPAGGAGVPTGYTIPVTTTDAANYTAGTGANQANKVFYLSATATAAVNTTDLTAAVAVDGQTGFAHVREFVIDNDSTTDPLTLTAVANTFTSRFLGTATPVTIPAGGRLYHNNPLGAAGWVVDGTHKLIQVDPAAATVPFRILVAGD